MDEKYTNSIIDSTDNYLYNLQYLAQSSPIDLRDIMMLDIIHHTYAWADWFELSESTKIKLQAKMDDLIFSNSNLVLPTIISYTNYFNANIPQTIWTWQRVYDNLIVNHPLSESEDETFLLDEDGIILINE